MEQEKSKSTDYCLYILECADGTYYTGITNDLEKRMAEHAGGKKGAKYTRGRGPFKVVHKEEFQNKGDALRREMEIKSMARQDKAKLVKGSAQSNTEDPLKMPYKERVLMQENMDEKVELAGSPGILYLCATPIGNLEDMTLRAIKTLQSVDLIAAEDTRHTRKLLSHFDIHVPLTSYHEHNKNSKGPHLIEDLLQGKEIALVTDAGMPGISDPGQDLVALALDKGIRVVPIPGASAGITALVISGLNTDKFVFEGFLPSQGKSRDKALRELAGEKRTIIFYEAPHRIAKTLKAMAEAWGPRRAAIVRELTKKYEEIKRGTLIDLASYYTENEAKGEFCLIVEGLLQGEDIDEASATGETILDPVELVGSLMARGMDKKDAIKEGARILGRPKREIYKAVIEENETK